MRYTKEDACCAWLMYAHIEPETLRFILRDYGSATEVYDQFIRTCGACLDDYEIDNKQAILLNKSSRSQMHQTLEMMQKMDIGVITEESPLYPDTLRNYDDSPPVLFYRGDLTALSGRCLTMIGTRNPTIQGMTAAQTIARGLSENGVSIISGLAPGLDTASHRGCLQGGSPTIGICACGIDQDYPAESYHLKEEMLEKGGLLLSQMPLGEKSSRWVFESRNRILSALGQGVIFMEGKLRSGGMITVRHALDQGKEVFAWPGIPGTPQAEAAHDILRDGGRFFTTADDILQDMKWLGQKKPPTKAETSNLPPLSPQQKRVLEQLRKGDLSAEQLASALHLDAPTLAGTLTILTIMGYIKPLPGKFFTAIL